MLTIRKIQDALGDAQAGPDEEVVMIRDEHRDVPVICRPGEEEGAIAACALLEQNRRQSVYERAVEAKRRGHMFSEPVLDPEDLSSLEPITIPDPEEDAA